MKRSEYLGTLILTGLLAGVAAAQSDSLADAARLHKQQQAGKPTTAKVFTNDDLPTTETINTVGPKATEEPVLHMATDGGREIPVESSPVPANAGAASSAAKDDAAKAKPADESKDRQKTWEDWRSKIQKQAAMVEQLEKDNEEIERQFKLTTGNYYNSAQQRIYDGAAMQKEDASYREQMEQKKKAIEEAKQKVDDLQEEARRAGVPSGYRE